MAGSSWTGKQALRAWLLGTTALLPAIGGAQAQSVAPNARPTGGRVVAGSASINQSSATTTTITQTTDRTAINWQSFNVGSQQTVQFQQPSATSWTLNRVTAPDPSIIAGRITANGGVAIVNQSGVVFAQGAQVNVGSLIASAANITNQNFMNGRMVFDGAPNPGAKVENHGDVTIADRGLAALVGPRVANSGTIRARLGRVALAGAETYSLDLAGDGLLSIDVTQAVRATPGGAMLVTNSGVIEAAGGSVLLTAHAASGLVEDLVRNTGRISAPTEAGRTGTVALRAEGGSVRVEGKVAATGAAGQRGGRVTATASGTVTVAQGASVDASGGAGGGTVAIGSSTRTRAARVQGRVTARGTDAGARGGVVTVQATDSVTVTSGGVADVSGTAGGGDIRLGTTGFGRNQTVAATTTVEAGARLVADATVSGDGGTIAVNSSALTTMLGTLSARGGVQGGNGGFIEVSALGDILSPNLLTLVDLAAPAGLAGTLLLDPKSITITAGGPNTAQPDIAADDAPAGGNINIQTNQITATTANLVLEASETITVDAAISKPLGNLTLRTTTNVDADSGIFVNAGITLGTAGAPATGGSLTLTSARGITVGDAITVHNGSATLTAATTLAVNEAVTAAASSTFTGTTGIDLQQAVSVGASNTLTLLSDGAVTSHATNGLITAATLDVRGATGDTAGAVTLNAANLISNLTVASSAAVSVVAGQALNVTSLTAGGAVELRTTAGLLTVSGSISSGGSLIDLEGAGGIALQAHVNAGAGALVLRTGQDFDAPTGTATISQNASGRITAASVAASAGGSITLGNSLNAFASLAVGRNRGGSGTPARSITSASGGVTIVAPAISVDAPIVAVSGTVRIDTTGTLTVAAAGSIDAAAIDLNATSGTGAATLIQGALHATTGDLLVANLTDDITTTGSGTLLADAGQIRVITFGNLNIGATATATAGLLRLESAGLMTIGAVVTGNASGIQIRAADLDIGARIAAPGGEINIRSVTAGLVIGIGADQAGGDPAGIYLNPTELALLGGSGAGGTTIAATQLRLTPSGEVNVLGDVALRGRFGALVIDNATAVTHAAGSIDVARVVATASGSIDLARPGATNLIDELAAASSGAGSSIAVSSANALTIVNDATNGVNGIGQTAQPATVTLNALSLALHAPVSATAVNLATTGGGISQTAGGLITATQLTADASAAVSLATATGGNLVSALTGSSGTGDFSFTASGGLQLIGGGVNAGANTATLQAGAGQLTQLSGAAITAGTLDAGATTGVLLATANNAATGNAIGSVTAQSTTGGVAIFSRTGLAVATGGVTSTTSGGISLQGQTLALNNAVTATGQTVTLTADAGGITQLAAGTITANALRLSAAGAISLTAATANAFNQVSGATTVGGIALRSTAASLTVDAALTAQAGHIIDITAPALTVNARIGFGAADAGNTIRLTTDALVAGGADTVDASTLGTVRIATQTGGDALLVGTSQLSDTSLEQVVAGRLILVAGGDIEFSTSQDFTGRGVTTLELYAGSSITQAASTMLTVANLTAIAGTGAGTSVILGGQNAIDTIVEGTEITGFGLRGGDSVVFTSAQSLLTVASGAVIQAGGGDILLRANDLALGAAIEATGGASATVFIQPNTAGRAVILGGTAANTLSLDSTEISRIAAGSGTLSIGWDGGTTTAGLITIAGNTSLRGHAAVLDLHGRQVVQTGGIVDVATLTGRVDTVNGVAAAGFAVDRVVAVAPVNTIDTIGGVTASAGGISLASANALAVTGAVTAGGGTISITSAAALTVTADVTATATAASGVALTAGTTLDIGAGSAVLVGAAGGDVTLTAGGAFTLAANATVRAQDPAHSLGNITVTGSTLSLVGTLDASTASNGRSISLTATDGRIVVAQTIDARQSITLNASGSASATIAGTGAAIVVNSGASITGGGFVTLNETTATGGGVVRDIDLAGTLRGTLGVSAATLTGALRVPATGVIDNSASAVLTAGLGITQAGSITAGSLVRLDAGTSGIGGIALTGSATASTGDVVVRARLGDIAQSAGTLTATSTAPRGTVSLVAEAGSITQSGTGAISATQLIARASGSVTLAGTSNAVGTLLGTGATGSLDSTAFGAGDPALRGSMAGGNFLLRSNAALLTLRGLVRAGTTVDSGGALVTETTGSLLRILADDIALDATGSPTGMVLQAPLGQIELAPHTLSGTPRAIVLGGSTTTNAGALTIDSTELRLIDTRPASGIGAGTVVIGRSDAGAMTLAGAVDFRDAPGSGTEYGNARARTLVLASGGAVTQTAGRINVENLAVASGGAVALDQVNVINAITGAVTTVSAAGASAGFSASGISANGAVTLRVGGRVGIADASLAASGTTPVLPPALDADGAPLTGVAALRIGGAITTNGAGDITIRADDLAVSAALTAGSGHRVVLQPQTAGQAVLLGGVVTGTVGDEPAAGSALSLTATELGFISADLLRIGGSTAGRVVQGQQAIDLTSSGITTLEVLSAYGFEQHGALLGGSAGSSLTVANFAATIDTAGRVSGADTDAASVWLGADNHITRIGDTTGLATSGGAGIRLTIDRATVDGTLPTNSVTIREAAGQALLVGNDGIVLNRSGGRVTLVANSGSITVDTGTTVSGGDVLFSAGTGITNLGSINATSGDLSLTALAGSIASDVGTTLSAAHDATLLATGAGGAITVANLTAGNSTTLTATGLVSLGSVIATAADAAITSNSGAISLAGMVSAGQDATLQAAGDITYGSVTAARNATLTSSTGDIIGNAASSITATSGTASLTATLGAFHLNAGATIGAAAVSLSARTASAIDASASVIATAGAATADVSLGTLTLGNGVTFSATGGLVRLAGNAGLTIGTGFVSATSGTQAGSYGSAAGALGIGSGALVLVDGLLTLDGATGVTFGGGTLRGGTGLSSTAATGDIDVAAGTALRATTGALGLTATAGTLQLRSGATVEALSGSATLLGQAGVTGGSGLTVSGSTGVTFTAATGDMDLADTTSISSSGGAALVQALAGHVSLGAVSLVSGGSSATVSAGGTGTVTLDNLTQVLAGSGDAAVTAAGIATLNGGITIRSTTAQSTLSGSGIAHTGQLTLQAATGFSVTATAGAASFGGGTSFTTTGGLGSVSATTSIGLGSAPTLTSTNGSISVSAGTGLTGGGAQITGGTGVSLATTTGNLDLVTAATIAAASGPVTLTASAGAVVLGSGSSLTAGSGALSVSGASGITANALTATASAGNASLAAAGTIDLGSGSTITADAGTMGLNGAAISLGNGNLIRSRDGTTLSGGAGGITGLASNQIRATNGAVSLTSAAGALNFGNSTSFVAGNGALTFSGGTGVTLGTGLTATAVGGGVISNAGSGSFSLGNGGTIGSSGATTLSGADIVIGANGSITAGTGLSVTANTGNFTAGDMVTFSTTASVAQLRATAGRLTLGTGVAASGSGGVTLSAGNAAGVGIDIGSGFTGTASGGNFDLGASGSVSFGTLAGITANGGQATVSGSSIGLGDNVSVQARDLASITATAGDVSFGNGVTLGASAGAATINAGTQAILIGNGGTVTGTTVTLTGTGGITIGSSFVGTASAGNASFSGGAGGVGINANAAVTATGGLTLTGIGIAIGPNGLLSADGPTSLTASTGTVAIAAGTTVRSTGGATSLTATIGNITLGDGATISSGAGDTALTSGNGVSGGADVTIVATGGNLSVAGGSSGVTMGGLATLRSVTNTTSVTGTAISFGNAATISSVGGTSLTAAAGDITLGDNVIVQATAGATQLVASTHIISVGNAGLLSGTSLSMGGTGGIAIGTSFTGTASTLGVAISAGGGDFTGVSIGAGASIHADLGTLQIGGGAVSIGSGSTLQSGLGTTLTAVTRTLNLSAGSTVRATAGTTSLIGLLGDISLGNSVTASGSAGLTLQGRLGIAIGTGFTGTASAGPIALTAASGPLTIGDAATVQAGAGSLDISGASVRLGVSSSFASTAGTTIAATAGALDIGNATSATASAGAVNLSASTTIGLGDSVTLTASGGSIALQGTAGVTTGNGLSATATASGGALQLQSAAGGVSIGTDAALTAAGTLSLSGTTIDIGDRAALTAQSALGITATTGTLILGAAGNLIATAGTSTLTATAGGITIGDGGVVRAGLGAVTLAAAGNIASGTLVESLTGAANLTSSAGSILLNGSATTNSGSVKAATDVVLSAATGISITGQAPATGSSFTSGIVQATTGGISLTTTAGNITQTGGLLSARGTGNLSFSAAGGSFSQAPDSGAAIDVLRLTGVARDGIELLAFSAGRDGAARGNRVENILALSSSAGAIRLQTVEAATSIGAVALTAPGAIQIWSERALTLTGTGLTSSGTAVASRIGTGSAADITGTRTSGTVGDWAGLVSLYSGGAIIATNITLNAEVAALRAGVPMLFNSGFGAQPQTLMLDGVTASIGSAAVFAGSGGILAGGATVISARGVGTSLPAAIFDSRVPAGTTPRTALMETALGEVRPDAAGTQPKLQSTKVRNGVLPGAFGPGTSAAAGDIALNLQMVARPGQGLQNQGAAFLLVGAGNVTGTIDAGRLGVVGSGGSMGLLGTLNGQTGANAAQFADISQVIPAQVLQRYRINGCVVTSINCVVPPAIQIVPPRTVDRANLTIEAGRLNTSEVIIPNVSDEDDDE